MQIAFPYTKISEFCQCLKKEIDRFWKLITMKLGNLLEMFSLTTFQIKSGVENVTEHIKQR